MAARIEIIHPEVIAKFKQGKVDLRTIELRNPVPQDTNLEPTNLEIASEIKIIDGRMPFIELWHPNKQDRTLIDTWEGGTSMQNELVIEGKRSRDDGYIISGRNNGNGSHPLDHEIFDRNGSVLAKVIHIDEPKDLKKDTTTSS